MNFIKDLVNLIKSVVSDCFNDLAKNGAFSLTLISIGVIAHLAYSKGYDLSSTLPTVLGLFLGQTTSRAISSHWAASKDPNSDSSQIIREVEGLVSPKKESKE